MKYAAFLRCVGVLGLCLRANGALADDADQKATSVSAAEVLFVDGVKLMKRGRCAEAAAKFHDSQRLDPASGTLLDLAYCQIQLGLLASAWLTYREALTLAEASQKPRHAQIAHEQAAKLEPELPRVVITTGGSQTRELVIALDGSPLPYPSWSLPVPVDPGQHQITTKLENGQDWQTTFSIAPAERVVIDIPLSSARDSLTSGAPGPAAAVRSAPPSPVATSSEWSAPPRSPVHAPKLPASNRPLPTTPAEGQRGPIWALGLAMAGAGAFTAGAVLFVSARVSYDSASRHCDASNGCPEPFYEAERSAAERARLALVFTGSGALLGGVGAFFFLARPSHAKLTQQTLSAFLGPRAAGIRGTW